MADVRKSQRAPQACLSCSKRRVRCDKKVPCGTCVVRGQEETCAREVVNVKGRLTNAKGQIETLPSYFELQEENERLKAQILRSNVTTGQFSASDSIEGSMFEWLEHQTNLQPSDSSYQRTVRGRYDISIPAQCCSVALLDHGFKWTHWLHLAIYMPRFRLEHDSAWGMGSFLSAEPQWLGIYFAFIAMSLMSMDENEAEIAGITLENTPDLVRNWYDASLFFLDEADFMRAPDLRSTQAIAILLGLAKNVGDFGIQPLLQVTGIRIGQILGMDCEPPRVSQDAITQEISRRTWWTLVICEWLCIPSRPPCIHEADFDVPVPSLLSDDDSGAHPKGLELIDYHHAMISLAKTVYRFRAQMAAIRGFEGGNALDAIVLRADEALANTIAELPSHLLDLSGRETASHGQVYPPWVLSQQTGLSLSFLYYRMAINRALQHRWASSDLLLARSKAVCLDSANAIVALMNDHDLTASRYWQWPAMSNIFSAALTLATEAKTLLDKDAAEEYISRVRVCLSLLHHVKGHSALASRAFDELRAFCIDLL